MITEFSLNYFNKNLYKTTSIEQFPSLIAQLANNKLETKTRLENNGEAFPSYDHFADAKAFHYQAIERYNIAKQTYIAKLNKSLSEIEEIVVGNPGLRESLEPMKNTFIELLQKA